jgi:hypothetical protein
MGASSVHPRAVGKSVGFAGLRWSGVALAAVLCGALAASCGDRETKQLRSAASESTQTKAPTHSAVSQSARAEPPGHLIESTEIDELREAGLTDPVQQLVDSLMAHPEIIPHSGVLGGRMGFYSPGDIHVLDARTVFARFNDGHIVGSGVFGFMVEPGGKIVWRVIDSSVEKVTIKD